MFCLNAIRPLLLLLAISGSSFGHQKVESGLVLTLPKVVQKGSSETVCVVLHDSGPPRRDDDHVTLTLRLGREDANSSAETGWFTETTETFTSDATSCFELQIPLELPVRRVRLFARASSPSFDLDSSVLLAVQPSPTLNFLQLDKPLYKPGETVKFRALRLDAKLLPILEPIHSVWIENPNSFRMAEWRDVEVQQGLTELELALSEEPTLGEWKLKMRWSSREEEEIKVKRFKVAEYTLPKYEVTHELASFVWIGEPALVGRICAKYTYGKPVRGTYRSKICRKSIYRRYGDVCLETFGHIDGCATLNIAMDQLTGGSRGRVSHGEHVEVLSEVLEEVTGNVINSTSGRVTLSMLPFHFRFAAPMHYKPNLPYFGRLEARRPNGSAAADVVAELELSYLPSCQAGSEAGDSCARKRKMSKRFTTDASGDINFNLPQLPVDVKHVLLTAWNPESSESTSPDPQAEARDALPEPFMGRWSPGVVKSYLSLQPWYSVSGDFVDVRTVGDVSDCGTKVAVEVLRHSNDSASSSSPKLHFQVVTDGNVVHAETVVAEFVSKSLDADWTFPDESATPQISSVDSFTHHLDINGPSNLVVFYVHENGETIAANTDVGRANCLKHNVSLTFDEDEKRPGSNVTVRLTGHVNSICSVAGVDKSVTLLAGGTKSASIGEALESHRKRLQHTSLPYDPDHHLYCNDWKDGRRRRSSVPWGRKTSVEHDSSTAFRGAKLAVLSNLRVNVRRCEDSPMVYFDGLGGRQYSPIMSVAPAGGHTGMRRLKATTAGTGSEEPEVEVRDQFPESWLWQLHAIGLPGSTEWTAAVPHTVTEWQVTAFCAHEAAGLGVAPPKSLRAFQPFFVSLDLPYSVVRRERLPVTAVVFSYVADCQTVELTLQKSAFFAAKERRTWICVCEGAPRRHDFIISPVRAGDVDVTVTAYGRRKSGVCGDDEPLSDDSRLTEVRDAVQRKLRVRHRGRALVRTGSSLVCVKGGVEEGSLRVAFPEKFTPGSLRSTYSLIGDVMGSSLEDLSSLVALPTGCGEQNMINFAPNVYVMQYLSSRDVKPRNVVAKALEFMRTGYQRELTYMHDDGSFSAFGKSDAEGSTWLTAFVYKSFVAAKQFIFIDDSTIDTVRFFRDNQDDDGCFESRGKILHKAMKGGLAASSDPRLPLTAYVLAALMEDPASSSTLRNEEWVSDAVVCLDSQPITDLYSKVLTVYALTLYDDTNESRLRHLKSLEESAITEVSMTHWSASSTLNSGASDHTRTSTIDVEMSAYMILTYVNEEFSDREAKLLKTLPIVRWLSTKRNDRGGFGSTQDTVIALQALAAFGSITQSEPTQLDVVLSFSGNQTAEREIGIDETNRLILHREIVAPSEELGYRANGTGCFFLQNVIKFHDGSKPALSPSAAAIRTKLQVLQSADRSCRKRVLQICSKYQGPDEESNMAVIELEMPSGWIPVKSSLVTLRKFGHVKRYELDGVNVNLYVDQLTSKRSCVKVEVERDILVEKRKPANVAVYDYYDPDVRSSVSYRIRDFECAAAQKSTLHNLMSEQSSGLAGPANSRAEGNECPICRIRDAEILKEKLCSYQHAYKLQVRKPGARFSLKLLEDLRQPKMISRFVSAPLAVSCSCDLLQLKGKSLVWLSQRPMEPAEGAAGKGLLVSRKDVIVAELVQGLERALRSIKC